MVRAFLGITLPEDIKRYLIGVIDQLKSLPISAKFVEPANLHVTLSFLGNIGDEEIDKIKFKLDEISKFYSKFEIILEGLTPIPNKNFVRVVALSINSEMLESVRRKIVETVGGISHPAHLTLARVRIIRNRGRFIEGVKRVVCNAVPVSVDSLYLIRSDLRAGGPVYTVVHRSYFK